MKRTIAIATAALFVSVVLLPARAAAEMPDSRQRSDSKSKFTKGD